jgi:hypothetical protein
MTILFLICAGLGALLVLILVIASLFGMGDHDVGVDHSVEHSSGGIFGYFSLRALAAAVGVFGLVGMISLRAGLGEFAAIAIAVVAGGIAAVAVGTLMRQITKLGDEGTFRIQSAVGRVGNVYIPIPGNGGGQGKVQLDVQGRTLELPAVTNGVALRTGQLVTVTRVIGNDTLEVTPVQGEGQP